MDQTHAEHLLYLTGSIRRTYYHPCELPIYGRGEDEWGIILISPDGQMRFMRWGVEEQSSLWNWSVRREGRFQSGCAVRAEARPRGVLRDRVLSLPTSGLTKGRWKKRPSQLWGTGLGDKPGYSTRYTMRSQVGTSGVVHRLKTQGTGHAHLLCDCRLGYPSRSQPALTAWGCASHSTSSSRPLHWHLPPQQRR